MNHQIPEDLKAKYERAKSALMYGQAADPDRWRDDISLIERIAQVEADRDALQRENERLKAIPTEQDVLLYFRKDKTHIAAASRIVCFIDYWIRAQATKGAQEEQDDV